VFKVLALSQGPFTVITVLQHGACMLTHIGGVACGRNLFKITGVLFMAKIYRLKLSLKFKARLCHIIIGYYDVGYEPMLMFFYVNFLSRPNNWLNAKVVY